MNETLADGIKKYEDVSATFAWTPLSCTIAKTNIELILADKLADNAALKGAMLMQQCGELFDQYLPEHTGDIRGMGLMIGIELVTDQHSKTVDKKLVQKFVIHALKQGLMVCASWDFQAIIMMPPLNINDEELHCGLQRIESVLQQVSSSLPKTYPAVTIAS
jgi:4-aminobutyrate aminotransferase-like enzyme